MNPPPFQPATGALRRLTRTQFRNAVRDVLGAEVDVNKLDPDNWTGEFAVIGAAAVVTSPTGVEQYHAAIKSAVNAVFDDAAKVNTFMGCTPAGTTPDACVRGFIEKMGRRAWRRPLVAGEIERLVGVAQLASTELGSAVEGARWASVAIFTSPNFLYRPELGEVGSDGARRFTGYEMASRLAFLLWSSLPDDQLLDDAGKGMLATPDGIRSAVERLFAAPAGREAVGNFAEEYLRLDRVLAQPKNEQLFPEYSPSLQTAMVRDMRGTWETLVLDDNSSALELFSTPKVVVNADLAKLYGLDPTGLDSNTFKVMTLPADGPRSGILGKAGFLSQFANQEEGSPTLRGKFIRIALMCQTIPPPPPDVSTMLEKPPEDHPLTKRQQLEMHRTKATCANCHGLMDPMGLPLESFDAIGKFRTTDHGLPIDPSGDFEGQPVADAKALGQAMSSSIAIAQCLARRYYAYAVGHEEREVDGTVVNALASTFQSSGFKLRDLIVGTVTHAAFSSVAPQP